jgi:hypothetical protein
MQKEDFHLEIRKLLLSFVPVFILLEEVSEDVKSRAVQIAGVRSPRQLNFAWWCLLFMGPKFETFRVTPLVPEVFKAAAGFFENLYTLGKEK